MKISFTVGGLPVAVSTPKFSYLASLFLCVYECVWPVFVCMFILPVCLRILSVNQCWKAGTRGNMTQMDTISANRAKNAKICTEKTDM